MNRMDDFVMENGVLLEYRGEQTEVVIPAEVQRIGSQAFWGCPRVTRVVMGDGVTAIDPRLHPSHHR